MELDDAREVRQMEMECYQLAKAAYRRAAARFREAKAEANRLEAEAIKYRELMRDAERSVHALNARLGGASEASAAT